MATQDRRKLRTDLSEALGDNISAAELGDVVEKHFPDLGVFRENDDLIVVAGGTHRLLIRRVAPESFRISQSTAASGSTNLLDFGEGGERDLDGLVGALADFARM